MTGANLPTLLTRLSLAVSRRLPVWQAAAGVVALALGLWGWTLHEPPRGYAGWFNNLFRTIQLITLQFPTSLEAAMPWQLQLARFAVPMVAVLATLNVLIGAITRPARLAMMPRARGHIIVSGAERMTEEALKGLAARGRRIVVVAPRFEAARREALEALGLTLYEADPTLAPTWTALNLKAASALFLTHADDIANLDIAVLALTANEGRAAQAPPLALAALIDREELAAELDAALDRVARAARVRYHRLCPDRDGLRLELAARAPVFLKGGADRPAHVLVVGLQGQWPQALMQVITAAQDHPEAPPRLTLALRDDEREAFAAFAAARPDLPLVADARVVPVAAGLLPAEGAAAPALADSPPDLALVLRDDADGVTTALALRRPGSPLSVGQAPVLVRRTQEDRLLARLAQAPAGGDAAAPLAGLVPFGGLIRAETIERILDHTGDERAIALHAHYLDAAPALGAGSPAALAAWEALPENLRDANRAAAEHAPILFAAGGVDPATAGAIPPAALERMARIEHRRWMCDRIDRGWRGGAVRDDARRIHPSLRPYDALAEADKEKDRNQVRVLAGLSKRGGAP
jgi:hypothetical protein